jgi:hypothetical protein
MGGNKTYHAQKVIGGSKAAESNIQSVQKTLEDNKKPAQVALAVVAAADPTIATVVTAAKFLHAAYKVYSSMHDTYEKTGDSDKALEAGSKKVVEIAAKEVRSEAIKYAIGAEWSSIKESEGIKTSETQDKMAVEGVSKAIDVSLEK